METSVIRRAHLSAGLLILLCAALCVGFASFTAWAPLSIDRLRVEYRERPLGLDADPPRLSWILMSQERAKEQSAYRILVASTPEKLSNDEADLWDSGKVRSDRTTNIEYAGEELASRQRCYWKVRVWDEEGAPSAWSSVSMWSMGLLRPDDWQAQWIGYPLEDVENVNEDSLDLPPSPYLRRSFETEGEVKRATLYATALGLYEMRLNGERVGKSYFTPGWTDYHKRLYYNTYDVTEMVEEGKNALGAILADGWYAGYVGFALKGNFPTPREMYGPHPALYAQLEVTYENGDKQVVTTDDRWKASTGPLKEASILMGTTYNALDEMPGWDRSGYDDASWEPVVKMNPEHGKVEAYPTVTVQRMEKLQPVEITERENGKYIVDMGQNFAGRVRLRMPGGETGEKVVLRYGEMLHQDGSLMTENLRLARATDTYVLHGRAQEVWEPQFTFHGFRYVEIAGYPGELQPEDITGIVIRSALPMTSELETSHPLVDQIFKNATWSQRSNFLDVPTDTPARDERMGWTGDAVAFIRAAIYNSDVAGFYAKWLVDVEDAQYPREDRLQARNQQYIEVEDMPDGAYPTYAPAPFATGPSYSPAWSDAGVKVPYMLYRAYGDERVIRERYEGMKRFMDFLRRVSDEYDGGEYDKSDHIVPSYGNDYGDWLAPTASHPRKTPTPKDLIATAFYAYDAKLMAEMARAIGKEQDAEHYERLYERVKAAFNESFVSDDGRIKGDTQTGYALAFDVGLFPEELREKAGDRLATLVQKKGLTTGFVGTPLLLPALTSTGHSDVAYQLLTSTSYPSWGYSIMNGATTTWERWDSYTKEGGFSDPRMNSFNHYAYGSVVAWMFATMAGIDTRSDGSAFQHIVIEPKLSYQLGDVHAQYRSIRGDIVTHWRYVPEGVRLEVSIPANTHATVYVPATSAENVREEDAPAGEGVEFRGMEEGRAVYEIGSGDYTFVSRGSKAQLIQ